MINDMEERTNLNFSISTELSLKIDKMLIDLKERGHVMTKTKPQLLGELIELGYSVKLKDIK
jgi:hypothetical protein